MCGIVGYIGHQRSEEIIIEGLQRLEYRGYDSAGVAIFDGKKIVLKREVGKLRNLIKEIRMNPTEGNIGIGHTRWATHGRPTEYNAHPHTDCSGKIVVVHNGIIENYMILRDQLKEKGHEFKSETDTEVIAHLIEENYKGNLKKAVQESLLNLEGSYAICVMHESEPDKLIVSRHSNPLIIGLGYDENFVASDIPAILNHTRLIIQMEDGQYAEVRRDNVRVFNSDGEEVYIEPTKIEWNLISAEKGGFDHFMLKEIYEQPVAFSQTIGGRVSEIEGKLYLDELNLTEGYIKQIQRICIVACGTAYHAGLVGKYYLENFSRIPVEVSLASEFRYQNPVLTENTLVIAISQSGETADTLAAVREAKFLGSPTIGIINVKGSAISREVKGTIYIHVGPEIGVASTKAYTSMLAALNLLALHFASIRGNLSKQEIREYIKKLKHIPVLMEEILEDTEKIQYLATELLRYHNCIYLGRKYDYPTALEGALKLKELSYIHAEGYAAGEMKHGPLALVDRLMPVITIATPSSVYEKVVNNIKEAKSRDALSIVLTNKGNTEVKDFADHILYVPETIEPLAPILNIIVLQLLAYYIALKRGCDVDQPRNLAKSVTVE